MSMSEMLEQLKMLSDRPLFVGAPAENGPLTIGGTCDLPGAVSPNNGRPLLQYAAVRLERDGFWIEGWRSENIHFLYSWKCDIHGGDFSYRQADGAITVLEARKKTRHSDSPNFPYADYPVAFEPRRFKFSTELLESRSGTIHQFGGTPIDVVQWIDPKACVGCAKEMLLAATCGDTNFSTEKGFVDNSGVQVLYWVCPTCQIVAARQTCD